MASAKRSQPPAVDVEVSISTELDTVYRQHGSWLLRFLGRQFGRERAEELAQETYVRLAASPAAVRAPRAFLARVALNVVRDQARRRAARPQADVDIEEAPGLGQAADQVELLALKEVVLALPRNLRDVFLLSRFAGLTYEEIAVRSGVSVHTVKVRMAKALALCAARMRG